MDQSDQVIRDLVRLKNVGGKAQVGRGDLRVGRNNRNHRNLRLGRQEVTDGIYFGADVRQRFVRVVIQFQARRDCGNALLTLRLDVIDPVRGRDRAFEGRGDKAADQFRIRADVNGRHRDRRDIAARILAHIDRFHRLQTGDENDKADHHREDRTANKKIGKRFHVDPTSPLELDSPAVWARDRC